MKRACIRFPSCPEGVLARRGYISTGYRMHSLKLFATVPSLQLEMGVWGDYDHP
jgi:hypothetical protein